MYEEKLKKIIEAYEHMDEYPQRLHETIRIKNVIWDDDDIEENPELDDISVDDMDVEYVAEYEGDHRGRTEEIEKQFMEFYGCIPYDYDVEILNVETIGESIDSEGILDGIDEPSNKPNAVPIRRIKRNQREEIEKTIDMDGNEIESGDIVDYISTRGDSIRCTILSLFNDGYSDKAQLYDTERGIKFIDNADMVAKIPVFESYSDESPKNGYILKVVEMPLYVMKIDGDRYVFSSEIGDAMVVDDFSKASTLKDSFNTMDIEVVEV